MIPRTPLAHAALHDVADVGVAFFDGMTGGHPRGYVWADGGELPEAEQLALDEMAVVHLVVPDRVLRSCPHRVHLTPEGEQAMSIWDSQFSAAHSAGVQCAAEPTQERAS